MINLFPITRIIAAISVLYTVFISMITFFISDPNASLLSKISIAAKGATAINLALLVIFHFGWRWIWKKIPSLNHLLFPDLNGEWDMTIYWHWGEKNGVARAVAHIKQNFMKMSMEVASGDSDSITLLAKPKKDPESGRAILYYIYRNTPKQKDGNNSSPYDGTAVLKLDHKSLALLEGNYYTDKLTKGYYELRKK